MANHSPCSLLPMFLIFTILLAVLQVAAAGRKVPTKANVADKKQPEWFIDSDGSVFIPGLGRVMVPALGVLPYNPPYSGGGTDNIGGGGDSGTGSTGGGTPSYVPGGDDTFVPNPGVEVPAGGGGVPVGGGGVPAVPTPQTARP